MEASTRDSKSFGFLAVVCAVFGTTFLAIKLGVDAGAPPFLFAGLRFVIAGSALFLGKRLKAAHALGIASGFAGVWLVVSGATAGAASAPIVGSRSLIASIVMVCAAVGFAGAGVLYKRLFDDEVDPIAVSALNMLSGGIVLSVLAALFERRTFPMRAEAILPLAYLVVVGSLVGHSAYVSCVRRAGPLFASSWCYVSPVIATAVGALALGERASLWSLAGAILTLLGVYVLSRAEMRVSTSFARGSRRSASSTWSAEGLPPRDSPG